MSTWRASTCALKLCHQELGLRRDVCGSCAPLWGAPPQLVAGGHHETAGTQLQAPLDLLLIVDLESKL